MPYYPDKAGPLILLDMVNDLRNATYQPGQLAFGQPEATVAHGRNTVLSVHPPQGTSFRLHYNRLDLEQLFGVRNLQFPDDDYQTSRDLVGVLNAIYVNASFTPEDFVNAPITVGPYPRTVTLIAAPDSVLVMGECQVTVAGQNTLAQLLTEEGQPILTQEGAPIILED
jgi:hypothetical protein